LSEGTTRNFPYCLVTLIAKLIIGGKDALEGEVI